MSKVVLKKDFKNGDILYDVDLNNNFAVIEAGINANEENLQEVIDQAIEELDQQLIDITADRGWDWNGGDRVTYFKGDTSQVNSRPITNGQLLYNKETGETAMDDDGERIVTGSGNVVAVSETEPTNEATKYWIKPITINGTETAEEYFKNSNNQWEKILNQPSGDTLPIGSIAQFGGETAPTNWLICDGQAVSRETYSELFAVIGTTYGDGNGSTTFNLPDFSSRSPMGLGTGTDGTNSETTTLGETKGEYEHTLTINEMPKHQHTITRRKDPSGLGNYEFVGQSGGGTIVNEHTGNSGGDQSHNTIHPVLGVNFIIKAKQSIGVVGTVTNDITNTNEDAVPNCKTVKGYADKAIASYGVSNESLQFVNSQAYGNYGIPLNDKKCSFADDNKFIFDETNHKITIGQGVSKIKISAKYVMSRGFGDYLNIYVKKNNNIVAQGSSYFKDWASSSPIITPQLIDVEQGDEITLMASVGTSETGKTFSFSYPHITLQLTLEEVE